MEAEKNNNIKNSLNVHEATYNTNVLKINVTARFHCLLFAFLMSTATAQNETRKKNSLFKDNLIERLQLLSQIFSYFFKILKCKNGQTEERNEEMCKQRKT